MLKLIISNFDVGKKILNLTNCFFIGGDVPQQMTVPLAGPGCCQTKSVGSLQYQLLEEGATPSDCPTPCIYSSLLPGDNKRYCFAPGYLASVCMSGGSPDYSNLATQESTEVKC